jgi:hypothetical protein
MPVFSFRTSWVAIPLFLTACQSSPLHKDLTASTPPVISSEPKTSMVETAPNVHEQIDLCRREMISLKQLNPKAYTAYNTNFDLLVTNSNAYNTVRGEVSPQTKETLDALYKYKTNQICAEIERAVLQALIQRGESVK